MATETDKSSTSTVSDGRRQIALLPQGHVYEACVRLLSDDDWAVVRLEANVALHTPDVVAFYYVDNDIWYPVQTFCAGWIAHYHPVAVEVEPSPSVTTEQMREHLQRVLAEDNPQDSREGLGGYGVHGTPPPITDEREQIKAGLRRGEYPVDAGMGPPKHLKDVWKFQGDPDPDGFGVIAHPHPEEGEETEPDPEVEALFNEARRNRELARLRAEADRETRERLGVTVDTVTPYTSKSEVVEDWHGKAKSQ